MIARFARLGAVGMVCALACLGASASQALAALETPVLKAATSVTGTSALLEGELNPGAAGSEGEYQFLYKVSTEACRPETEYNPKPPGLAAGLAKEAVHVEATNLEPGATYSFCLIEFFGSEEVESAPLTFTTLAKAKPLILSTGANEATPFSATLSSQINPEKEATSYSFEIATNEALTENAKTIAGSEDLPAEFGGREASVPTGRVLKPETTYYFKVTAKNGTGTSEGTVTQFTTSAAKAPAIDSETITALNSGEPKFEAKINPNFQETKYQFEYSTSEEALLEGNGSVAAGASALPAVSGELLAGPTGVHGLSPGPTYYYRVIASNSTGTSDGPVQKFTALAVPAVSTVEVSEVTRSSALVSGTVTAQGLATTYHFAYVPSSGYEEGAEDPYAHGRATYETKLLETGYGAQRVNVSLEELKPGTTYHFALVATNELGQTTSEDGVFTTAVATLPSVSTGSPQGVGEVSATITGTLDTNGLQSTTQFEFGTTPGAGALMAATAASSSGMVLSLTASVQNLQPGTTYYYRAVARNRYGTSYGSEQAFTTSALTSPIAIPGAPAAVPYPSIAELNAKEASETPKPSKPLTRAQKLQKALKLCRKDPKKRRQTCERKARKQYGPAKAKKKKG
ncbi:MAG TPA: hypothetical protein VHT29_02880 [Solirubrobacteraceae bacterium]|nr:hypothetical protein [Solirubrobacteraceae bacterium]